MADEHAPNDERRDCGRGGGAPVAGFDRLDPAEAAARARRLGIPLYTVALGVILGEFSGSPGPSPSFGRRSSDQARPSTGGIPPHARNVTKDAHGDRHGLGVRRGRRRARRRRHERQLVVDLDRQARVQDTALTGDTADKVKAAALEKVPGGTVLRVEEGGPYSTKYHAHVRRSDGTEVVVLVNASFEATAVQTRPAGGKGGAAAGGPRRPARMRP